MVPDISTGSRTRGLLAYLYGPGRRDEHEDPHIVAAWDLTGAPDPGRDPGATLTELAERLDLHAKLRAAELGRMPQRHVWHCPVRTAPGDRYLTDDEWAQVARRIVHATGIASDDDPLGCRWIAVRHADDHIHIVATTVRVDGRRPRSNGDGRKAQAECRRIERDFGLRRLNSGDFTAPQRPTSAEQAKAARQAKPVTDREWLRDQVADAVAAARDEAEFVSTLRALGIRFRYRTAPSGDHTGYSVAVPETADNTDQQAIWYGGAKLAKDLSLSRIRERLAAQNHDPTTETDLVGNGEHPWRRAHRHLYDTRNLLTADITTTANGSSEGEGARDRGAEAQAHIAAFGELLYATARTAPPHYQAELRAAAAVFHRATRSARRAHHQAAAVLRDIAKDVARIGSDRPGDPFLGLVGLLVDIAVLAVLWHRKRRHLQQAAAAQAAIQHLTAARDHARADAGARLANTTIRPITSTANARLIQAVHDALPEHADTITRDRHWPLLAHALAVAETAGHNPAVLLADTAARRELHTATHPAKTLYWRITQHPAPPDHGASSTTGVRRRRPTTITTLPSPTPPAPPTGPRR
ncbi:relaxase/mobilization nuclease domain-containing protein [Streptodolium elevatio]